MPACGPCCCHDVPIDVDQVRLPAEWPRAPEAQLRYEAPAVWEEVRRQESGARYGVFSLRDAG